MDVTTPVGVFAALATTGSYFRQLKKCWDTGVSEKQSVQEEIFGRLLEAILWIATLGMTATIGFMVGMNLV